jgi:molecular chaperone GrpE
MSNAAPPVVPETIAVDPGAVLTDDAIAALLGDFGAWLRQAAAAPAPAPAAPEFSWQALAAEFTALRQEVHLQTRNSRSQLEQNAAALEQLSAALEALGTDEGGDAQATLRPLVKTLLDVYDALALARRQVQRVQESMAAQAASAKPPLPAPPVPFARGHGSSRMWWPWRWIAGDDAGQARHIAELEAALHVQTIHSGKLAALLDQRQAEVDRAGGLVAALITGYSMGLQRIEHALEQHGLEAITCVGEPFDPEQMEVVEVVPTPGQIGTMVIEEVRRGYMWEGRVFRFAQVRVAGP